MIQTPLLELLLLLILGFVLVDWVLSVAYAYKPEIIPEPIMRMMTVKTYNIEYLYKVAGWERTFTEVNEFRDFETAQRHVKNYLNNVKWIETNNGLVPVNKIEYVRIFEAPEKP